MPRYDILGLYEDSVHVSDAIARIRSLGVPDSSVHVISGMPYAAGLLDRPKPKHAAGRVALIGSVLGIMLACFLTFGIYYLYTLNQGGQPLLFPVPPSLIVFFEVTMLGTMYAAFFGFLLLNRLPSWGPKPYSPQITEGRIGVVARVDTNTADKIEDIFNQTGGHHIQREVVPEAPDRSFIKFWGAVLVGGAIATIILLIFVYDIIRIPFPSQMIEQESVAYEQGPRLAAPTNAVPIQGPVFIKGEPAAQPIKSSPDSIQRGSVLFGLHCQLCHGKTGEGNGPVGAFFTPKPANLTSPAIQQFADADLFKFITNGFGVMPPMYENLTINERWDVINFVRTLKK